MLQSPSVDRGALTDTARMAWMMAAVVRRSPDPRARTVANMLYLCSLAYALAALHLPENPHART